MNNLCNNIEIILKNVEPVTQPLSIQWIDHGRDHGRDLSRYRTMASYVLTWEKLSSRAVFLHSIPYLLCHDTYKN